MKKLVLISTGVLVLGFTALFSPALAQAKTA